MKVANASPTVLTLVPLRCAKRSANGCEAAPGWYSTCVFVLYICT